MKEKNMENKKECLNCGKPLTRGQTKFCSTSCSATYNNKGRKHTLETRSKISKSLSRDEQVKLLQTRYCPVCNKVLKNYSSIYCSIECYHKFEYNKNIEEWKNSPLKHYTEYLPSFIKKYLFEKYNNKCQKCGWGKVNPYTNRIPLEVHHIDGDCTNNREENLQLLCPNCHSLTENYGARNKHSRRYKLKEYKNKTKRVITNEVNSSNSDT